MQNRIKSKKYFSAQQYQNFGKIQHYTSAKEQNRFIQRNKKDILRRDTLRISVAAIQRCTVKKVYLKILPPVYLHIIKGYLCYKTITSQYVSSEAQVKDFFVSQKSSVLFLRYSSFCIFNHPLIYQICDVMTSISK